MPNLPVPTDPALDRLAYLAARLFDVPFALVVLTDCKTQRATAYHGPGSELLGICETTCAGTFCAQTIFSSHLLIVQDVSLDPRFAQIPLRVGEKNIRFYAGAPLITAEGCTVGVLCLMDFQPRTFTADQNASLHDLAASVVTEIELRRMAAKVTDGERLHRQMFADNPHPMWVFDIETLRFLDVNETALVRYGYDRTEFLAMTLADILLPEDLPRLRDDLPSLELQAGDKSLWQHRIKDGRPIWAEVAVHSIEHNGRAAYMVIAYDVTERKQTEEALHQSERLAQGTLNGLSAQIAILNAEGAILAVNDAWRLFSEADSPENGTSSRLNDAFQHQNYLQICEQAQGPATEEASRVAAGIRAVLHGEKRAFTLDYPCHSPLEQRWFMLRATRFSGEGPARIVVAHENITERKKAETALLESEVRFREIAETIQEVFWISSPDRSSIEYISPAYERLWGRSCAELYARPDSYLKAIHPDDRALVLAKRQAGPDYDNEYRIVHPNGAIRWVRTRSFPVRDTHGVVQRLVGLSEDVTERRESQERYRLLAESMDDMVSLHEMDGRCVYVSPSVLKTTGYTSEETVGRNAVDFIDPDDHLRLREAVEGLVEEDQPALVEVRWLCKDGRCLWVEARISLVHSTSGGPDRLVSVARDISARRQMEDDLRGIQKRLQTIITHVPVIIYAINADRVFTFTDGSGLAAVGRRPGESVGKSVSQVYGDHLDFIAAVERAFEGIPLVTTMEVLGVIFEIRYSPVFDHDGLVESIIGLAIDVTESRRAEQALRRSEERLNLALQAGRMGLWDYDLRTGRITGSDGYMQLFGRTGDTLDPTIESLLQCVHPDDRARLVSEMSLAASEWTIVESEYRVVRPDGTIRWLVSKGQLRLDAQGKPVHLSGATMDITERKVLESEREVLLAQTKSLLAESLEREDQDPLTGLINHRAFHKRLKEEIEAVRNRNVPIVLLLMDLDNFKFFNDAYGHLAGDDVLRRIAQALLAACGPQDTLARFGGDEFALLMPGATAADAERIVGRLREAVALVGYRPPGYDTSIPLSLSFGCACLPDDGSGRTALLENADARLRIAKSGGDNDSQAIYLRRAMARSVEGFSMLDALVTAVDNKDRYTRKHSEGVMTYSLQIARQLGLNEKTQHVVEVAALLHDVGKIGVPDAILRKPGALTQEDFQAIQQHPLMGAIIVGAVPGFEETLDAVRHHHERWDGNGYPFGLRCEQIPLMARLMAVADAYSAMTTDRPYRKGMEPARARRILEEGAGTQWDPACVQAFLQASP